MNAEVAQIINTYMAVNTHTKFILIDHHKTALHLNQYSWANVYEETNILQPTDKEPLYEKTSGAYNFLLYILENDFAFYPDYGEFCPIYDYLDNVRKYDTWLWTEKYNEIKPKHLSELCLLYGRDKWVDRVVNCLKNKEYVELSELDITLLEITQAKIDRYLKNKNKYLVKTTFMGYNVGVVFSEQYTSELGTYLCTQNPDIDFAMLINPSYAISLRTIKNDIDLGAIAQKRGSGGHPKAAAINIGTNLKQDVINILLKG
jgi:oligoribonuclease NrnB/cAMP/cGMP phosphodiesterase (DHH superfamily)